MGLPSASEETWTRLLRNQPQGDFARDLPGWLAVWEFLNGRRAFDRDAAIAYTRALYSGDPRNAQVAVNHVHAMSTIPASLPDDLTRVRCPFLVLHGTDDPLVPFDHGAASARLVPGSRLVALEGAGHMFFNDEAWVEIRESVSAHRRSSTK